MMKKLAVLIAVLAVLVLAGNQALAAGGGKKPSKQDWHFSGVSGTYDRAALQRGFKVYKDICSACHSMNRVYYRNLADLGYNENQVKNIAAEYTVIDGPDEEGDMFERPGRPSDAFKAPFANEQQAKSANGGAYPPDLSLISKARAHGPDYIYALLTGYAEAPEGKTLMDGQYYNKYMAGNIIAMAPPLSDGMISYEDGSAETVSQYAKDIAEFLAWAAEPHMEKRKQTGIKVILFLLVFAGVMYAYKKKTWSSLH